MELSQEDLEVLAHVVIDPKAWVAHALETVGEKAIFDKISRYKSDYEARSKEANYKTRAVREAEEWIKVVGLTYADLRRLEYAPVGDQLDNITESLKFLMESGIKIGEFGEAQVKMSQTVKDKYPKPI